MSKRGASNLKGLSLRRVSPCLEVDLVWDVGSQIASGGEEVNHGLSSQDHIQGLLVNIGTISRDDSEGDHRILSSGGWNVDLNES